MALRNLLVRKARTALSLTGLTVAILGIIALISVSRGIRALLEETISAIPGITVLHREVHSPAFSSLPAALGPRFREVAGVHVAVGQVWYPAFEVEGQRLILQGDPFNMYILLGIDIAQGVQVRDRGPIGRGIKDGRNIEEDADEIVIPKAAARKFGKKVGDRFKILGHELTVAGIFDAGSLLFDRCLVVPIRIARAISGKAPDLVSAFYVELEDGAELAAAAKRIEERFPETKAWTLDEVNRETGALWRELDYLLYAIASIAVFVGAVGIVNTMLMSVMERTAELGVLRATGWTRRDVVRLILTESAALGVGGGLLGCGLGAGGVALAGTLLPLKPVVTPDLLAASFALAVALGAAGGLYPALRASRLDPIEAIRI